MTIEDILKDILEKITGNENSVSEEQKKEYDEEIENAYINLKLINGNMETSCSASPLALTYFFAKLANIEDVRECMQEAINITEFIEVMGGSNE